MNEVLSYTPVLSPKQREQYRRRIQTQLGWEDPAIHSVSCQRFYDALEEEDHELRQMWRRQPQKAVIRQRTTEMNASLDPHAVWLCAHHTRQAREVLQSIDSMVNASMDEYDRTIFGNGQHRTKVLRDLPDRLRTRLDPVLKTESPFPSKLFEARFNEWADAFLADMPERSRKNRFPEAYHAYHVHRGTLIGLLDEMLELFGPFWADLDD